MTLHITSSGKCKMGREEKKNPTKTTLRKMVLPPVCQSKSDSEGKIVFLTLGKNVRVTNCLYSKKGMPWLRFSSLVRSVMSVCSSAKPGRTKNRNTQKGLNPGTVFRPQSSFWLFKLNLLLSKMSLKSVHMLMN